MRLTGPFAHARHADSGTGTKLVLDHKGFPEGDGKSLLDGWNKNYWEPLTKFLA